MTSKYGLLTLNDNNKIDLRDTEPQEYWLSHILADYKKGVIGRIESATPSLLITISAKDESVKSDGSWDFKVPMRTRPFIGSLLDIPFMFLQRIPKAWKVLKGEASILMYK